MVASRRIIVPVAALLGLATMLVVSPSTAGATPDKITAGSMILFQNSSFGGGQRSFTGSLTEFSGQKWSNGASMQNSASSMENFSDSFVGLWDIGTSCTGASYVAKPNSVDSTFSNNGFNDKASCLKFI